MKILFPFFLSCLMTCCAVGQTTYRKIKRDTINISGYLYDHTGKPLRGQIILSRARELVYDSYQTGGTTDDNGHFTIKGALFNDTLTVENPAYRQNAFYNRGSRYMVIYLSPSVTELNTSQLPVLVKAVRSRKVSTPTFKVQDFNGCVVCGVTMEADFPGGKQRFIDYLYKSLSYPEQARANNIEGMVRVGFSVDKDGTVIDPIVLNGIGYGCEQAVVSLLKVAPKWKPAVAAGGRAVKTQFEVSVEFRLTDK